MKKAVILSAILLVLFPYVNAQLFTTSLKLIEKADYANAEKKILKTLSSTPADVEENYAYALLLSKKKYSGYNNEKAYEILNKTISFFDAISDEKEIKKMAKIPITISEFDKLNDSICLQASEIALLKNDIQTYEKFLSFYLNCPGEYKKKVIESRNMVAFKASCTANSIESYQDFINKYPDAVQFKQAIASRDSLAFLAARKIDNISTLKDFTTRYPEAVQVPKAIERIHELAFEIAKKENKASGYQSFITDYPESKQNRDAFDLMEKCQFYENTVPGDWLKYAVFTDKFPKNAWVKAAQDSIYKIATQSANLEVLSYCVQNFTGDVRKNALLLYHEVFTMDGEKFTMDMFHSKYKDDFLSEVKSLDYQIVALADELKLSEPYDVLNFTKYDQFIRIAAPRDKALAALQKMITPEIDLKNWTAAQQKISSYAPYFGTKNKKFTDLVMFVNSQIQP